MLCGGLHRRLRLRFFQRPLVDLRRLRRDCIHMDQCDEHRRNHRLGFGLRPPVGRTPGALFTLSVSLGSFSRGSWRVDW